MHKADGRLVLLELPSKTIQSEILEVAMHVLALENSLSQAYPGSSPSVGAVLILKKELKLQSVSKSQNTGVSTVREKLGEKKEIAVIHLQIGEKPGKVAEVHHTSLPFLNPVCLSSLSLLSFSGS